LPVTRPALVLILRQFRAALLVDRIDRMAEISAVHPLPLAFNGEERRWYRGLAYLDDSVIPVVEPTGFLTPEEFQKLDRASSMAASQRETEAAVQA
jgi:chemotaxis signal transduction protein